MGVSAWVRKWMRKYLYRFLFLIYQSLKFDLAEEVGVEPTRRLLSVSTALKAARPTGDDTLPQTIRR